MHRPKPESEAEQGKSDAKEHDTNTTSCASRTQPSEELDLMGFRFLTASQNAYAIPYILSRLNPLPQNNLNQPRGITARYIHASGSRIES
jgi:hypothetical protein